MQRDALYATVRAIGLVPRGVLKVAGGQALLQETRIVRGRERQRPMQCDVLCELCANGLCAFERRIVQCVFRCPRRGALAYSDKGLVHIEQRKCVAFFRDKCTSCNVRVQIAVRRRCAKRRGDAHHRCDTEHFVCTPMLSGVQELWLGA